MVHVSPTVKQQAFLKHVQQQSFPMAMQWSSLSSGHYIHFSNGTFLAAVLLLLLLLKDASPPAGDVWWILVTWQMYCFPLRLCRHMLRNINLWSLQADAQRQSTEGHLPFSLPPLTHLSVTFIYVSAGRMPLSQKTSVFNMPQNAAGSFGERSG